MDTSRCRIACVDVAYDAHGGAAAAVAFVGFDAADAAEERVVRVAQVAPYEPGRFYLRELPCIRAALAALHEQPAIVIVDGYVWLTDGAPGLGARLFEERGGAPVIGVAKTPFRGGDHAVSVLRGTSKAPLFVTARGMDANQAAEHVRGMRGPHRLPTLLKRADTLCRAARM